MLSLSLSLYCYNISSINNQILIIPSSGDLKMSKLPLTRWDTREKGREWFTDKEVIVDV